MDPTRRRFGSLLEWFCAAVCAVGGVLLASLALENFRYVPAVVPVIAEEAPEPPAAISGIPPGVARVPLLLLTNMREVHLGDRLDDVAERLGATTRLDSESREDVSGVRRVTRFYSEAGVQFILVFDARGSDQTARVSAIFIR